MSISKYLKAVEKSLVKWSLIQIYNICSDSLFMYLFFKEGKSCPVRQAQMKKPSTAVSDIISSMLKDTTAEHKTHLFDLKCRICTGKLSTEFISTCPPEGFLKIIILFYTP